MSQSSFDRWLSATLGETPAPPAPNPVRTHLLLAFAAANATSNACMAATFAIGDDAKLSDAIRQVAEQMKICADEMVAASDAHLAQVAARS